MTEASPSDRDAEDAKWVSLGEGRRLHLGGKDVRAGWEILNAQRADGVDHVGDIRDLSRFEEGTFAIVYASHVFEHLGHQTDVQQALSGVLRVLQKGGKFMVSVPNLMTLAKLFSHPDVDESTRLHLMRMIFGGQTDAYDFHYVGFWFNYLASLLSECGFTEVRRVKRFGIFEDSSTITVGGILISLNVVAVK